MNTGGGNSAHLEVRYVAFVFKGFFSMQLFMGQSSSKHCIQTLNRMTPSGPKETLGSAPLTIFYGGNVNVFNDVSVEMVTTESICVQKRFGT